MNAPPVVGRNRRMSTVMKLWLAVVVANVIGLVVAVFVAKAIRAVPETAGTESALRFAYYGTMILVALVDALWIDELAFKGAFRITHLQGKSARYARKDESLDVVAATMQRTTFTFPASVLVMAGVTYLFFNIANHDFDPYYRRVGKHISALRGDDEAGRQNRIDAIVALSMNTRPEVMPTLIKTLERDDELASWAAWAIGRQRESPMARAGVRPLIRAYRGGGPLLQREALIALARLQRRGFAKQIQAALDAELDSEEAVDARLVWSLGYVQKVSSLPVLEKALYHRDETVQRLAAWALAQHRDEKGGRQAITILSDRLPAASFNTRCAIVHSLGIASDEWANEALIDAYDRSDQDERFTLCEKMTLLSSPDGKHDERDLFEPRETFAMKVLQSMGQMRATSAPVREKVEPWLERLSTDEDATLKTREAAQSLLSGIRAGRDDRLNPDP